MNVGLSVANPALLWGLGAVVAPVLIHFLLRPRPRRVRFPALTMMRAALVSGQRASRVRNVLLLLLRAAVLACAAVFLAGPTCAPQESFQGGRPAACVIVLDDSLSARYRPRFDDAATLLDESRRQALELIAASEAWPAGSRLAALRAGAAAGVPELSSNRAAAVRALRIERHNRPHAGPLGPALRQAAEMLRAAAELAPRVVVFTDGLASAWRDVRPAIFAGLEGLEVRVVCPSVGVRSNLSLIAAEPPVRVYPAAAEIPLRVTLGAAGMPGECALVARRGDEVLTRVGPLKVPADARLEVTLWLPPSPPGPHSAVVELEPEDLFPFDQQRHVTWETGPRPETWLLISPATDPDQDLSVLILRNLVAPDALEPEQQRVTARLLTTVEANYALTKSAEGRERSRAAHDPVLIVIFPEVLLSTAARDALVRRIEAGTTVLLVPGSTQSDFDWPGLRGLLGDAAPESETLTAGTTMQWVATSDSAFSRAGRLEFARCHVQRRMRWEQVRPAVQTLASYGDGVPAILSKPVGRGRLLALTTSPDPQWSDLGIRAAGLLTWLHHLVDEALGPPAAVAQFVAGDEPQAVFRTLPRAGLVSVSMLEAPEGNTTWLRLRDGRPDAPWPTDTAGIYAVRTSGDRGAAARYAVNWDVAEFDATPLSRAGLMRAVGIAKVTIEQPAPLGSDSAPGGWRRRFLMVDPAAPLALALLTLFVLEMIFAARRRTPAAA